MFSQLEGSSLFQMQLAQAAEAALEAAGAAAAASAAQLDGEAGALQREVEALEGALAAARARCAALQAGAQASSGGSDSQTSSQLAALTPQLEAAYEAAGFVPDASVTPLQMLRKVEAALEECLAAVGPPGSAGALAAEAVERAREKERRQAARAGKLAAQQVEHVSTRWVGGGCTWWVRVRQPAVLLSLHPRWPLLAGGAHPKGAAPRGSAQVYQDRQARHDAQRAAGSQGGGGRGTRRGRRGGVGGIRGDDR